MKKLKKKIKKKLQTRTPLISPHFPENTTIGGLDLTDGIFSFLSPTGEKIIPTQVEIGEAYNRETGKIKVINRVQVDSTRIDLNSNNTLAAFDWLFAIDTNTRGHNGSRISISSSVLAFLEIREPTSTPNWTAKVVPQEAVIFRNAKVNPEVIAWQELINRILGSPHFKSSMKIGVIVDSELGRISSINSRKMPLLGGHNLPENFQLIYASADVGADYPQNKLLRICDRTSSLVWDFLSKNHKIIEHLAPLDNPFIDGLTTLPSALVFKLSEGGKNWQG